MTTLIGSPNERWPLSRAVDALVASARRAGVPGLLWAVGLVYPGLGLGLGVVHDVLSILDASTGASFAVLTEYGGEPLFTRPDELLPGAATFLALGDPLRLAGELLLLLPLARLIVGLAALSDPERWRAEAAGRRPPRLRAAWRAGGGLTLSTFGILLAFPALLFGAVVFLLGPVVVLHNGVELLRRVPSLLIPVLMPVGIVVVAYGVLLQVLVQLALHSLARNRRGAASALTHAWRLVRNSPWGAVRATVVDLVLLGAILLVAGLLEQLLARPGVILAWCLWCFVGVMRAGYWARTYEGLGGLATATAERDAPRAVVPSS